LEFPQISRFYMEEFYTLAFRGGSDLLGELNDVHKVRFIASTSTDNAYRWVHLAGNLLGDPELHMWRSVPDSVVFAGTGTMTVSDTTYTLTVTHAGSPVSGVRGTMWNGSTKDV